MLGSISSGIISLPTLSAVEPTSSPTSEVIAPAGRGSPISTLWLISWLTAVLVGLAEISRIGDLPTILPDDAGFVLLINVANSSVPEKTPSIPSSTTFWKNRSPLSGTSIPLSASSSTLGFEKNLLGVGIL